MITIREVKTRRDRLAFINFTHKLYAGVPQFVPNMVSDELANLTPEKNPAADYCDMRFFLAERDGKIVGRVGAIISHKANALWNTKQLRITRLDMIEDYEVFVKLMETVEAWGREQGLTEAIGPIGFCDTDKEGMLVDGFHLSGMFITYYNYPYYVEFMERYGFEKEVDWTEHIIKMNCPEEDRLKRLAERVIERTGFHVLRIKTKKQLRPYVRKVFELINSEYKDLYGIVPLTDRQMEYYAGQFLMLLNLRYISLITDDDDNLVALGINAPSLADAMRACKGRLFPFGWIPTLRAIAKPKVLDMYFIAVKEEYRKSGLPAALMYDIYSRAKHDNILYAETGPELETNHNVQTIWGFFEREMNVRRRRCWKKPL